jgi:thiol-disulfide isomerase/thioredoxin
MNTKALLTLLPITLGLAVAGLYGMITRTCAGADGSTPEPAAAAAVAEHSETESSARVNMKSLAKNLEFLGEKPVLADHPLLIEFWATWCPPCRASIAHLNELNKKYHDRGLEIVGITSEDKSVVERFRARTPMNYAVALDASKLLNSEPSEARLAMELRIAALGHRGDDWPLPRSAVVGFNDGFHQT